MSEETTLPFARSFWELIVYQKARTLQGEVFKLTRTLPREETFSLTDQVRRAARSIGAQIAEAWGKRAYQKHFASKLTDAIAETYETQHWLITAVDDGYIAPGEAKKLFSLTLEIGRMLHRMVEGASPFCQDGSSSLVRETSDDWFRGVASAFPVIEEELSMG